jgi:hypothetical protein
MPTTEQIVTLIDARLVAAGVEIGRLQAAQRALRADAPRSVRRRQPRPDSHPDAPQTAGERTRPAPSPAVAPGTDRPPRRTRRARATTGALTPEQVESLLSEGAGSSAALLETRLGGERARILAMLRELEAGGRVRRSGQRRTTLWHVVTDEDRVAALAAR